MKQLISFYALLILSSISIHAQKPIVWLISDGGKNINDPDDISAIASYLLMSNHFETEKIILGSTILTRNKNTENQKLWAENTYGNAYKKDIINLNKYIGGYQEDISFLESSIKGNGEHFSQSIDYNLRNYPSILELYKCVKKSKRIINILSYGPLTEQAIFVSYCLKQGQAKLLEKVRFISHWNSSNFHAGTIEHPEKTHNCMGDASACAYMKLQALNGNIKYYECGGIGQHGIVENGQKGSDYYEQFAKSNLGKIFFEGKFNKNRVDDSDSATYWVLLGNYGVDLKDIANNGLNFPEVEQRNEAAFKSRAKDIRNELLRRSNIAAGLTK